MEKFVLPLLTRGQCKWNQNMANEQKSIVNNRIANVCLRAFRFTAGAMGAGKGYTIKKLVEKGRFPLLAFVRVNPDAIRRYMPEYHLYIETNPELAGELTNKEAGFIAEILTLAGLQRGKNVMVDGSLRHADWYRTFFERLRKEFQDIRLAIIHVVAPREAIFRRAAVSTDRKFVVMLILNTIFSHSHIILEACFAHWKNCTT